MFEIDKPIEISGPFGGTMVDFKLRWPTDQEWEDLNRARKNRRKDLGRGVSTVTQAAPGAHDLKLYDAIKLNGAPEISEADAKALLDLMEQTAAEDVTFDQNEVVVKMRVIGGSAVHRMRLPTMGQMGELDRLAANNWVLPFGHVQFSVNISPGAKLYDQCGGRSDDYAGAIPGIHKDAAVRYAIAFCRNEFGPKRDDANF